MSDEKTKEQDPPRSLYAVEDVEPSLKQEAGFHSPQPGTHTSSPILPPGAETGDDAAARGQAAAEKALLWRQDKRIVPLSAAIYLLCYLDRSNIGNAKVLNAATHNDFLSETHMTDRQYVVSLMVFLVAYGLFEAPSNVLLKKLRPSRWIAVLMFGWGACSMGLAAARGYAAVVAVRFVLGVFEAGLFPGLVYYITFWYRIKERSVRIAFVLASATLSGAFGGAIAYGVGSHLNQAHGLSAWRWLFLIEGAPSCLGAFFVFFFLPDYPETSGRWLSARERALAAERLRVEGSKGLTQSSSSSSSSSGWWHDAKATVLDGRLWCHYVIYFGISVPFSSLSLFTPSLTAGLGYADLEAQLMTVPPYAVAYVVQLLVSWSADRSNARALHAAAASAVGAAGFLASALLPADAYGPRYGCLIVAAAGAFACIPPLLGWLSANIFSTASVGLALALNIGLGGAPGQILGTWVYKADEAKAGYPTGHATNAGLLFFVAIGCVLLRVYYGRQNGKILRGRLEGQEEPRLYKY